MDPKMAKAKYLHDNHSRAEISRTQQTTGYTPASHIVKIHLHKLLDILLAIRCSIVGRDVIAIPKPRLYAVTIAYCRVSGGGGRRLAR